MCTPSHQRTLIGAGPVTSTYCTGLDVFEAGVQMAVGVQAAQQDGGHVHSGERGAAHKKVATISPVLRQIEYSRAGTALRPEVRS